VLKAWYAIARIGVAVEVVARRLRGCKGLSCLTRGAADRRAAVPCLPTSFKPSF
jgi:hypothetical protein